MLQSMQNIIPAEWSGTVEVLATPVAWLPTWQTTLINFAWYGGTVGEVVIKRGLLLLPIMLLVAAMWSTMVSIYTLPFRSGRGGFLIALSTAWWDVGRTIWFFWAGVLRLGVVVTGWVFGLVRLAGALLKSAFQSPLNFLDWASRNYFKPGVPWIAFLGLILWAVIEALIFTYTLRPTMTEVLAGITGFEPNPMMMTPILWIFLFFLILGSFACIKVLGDAMSQKHVGTILQMVFVELSVIFFEVIFLYREMIDALTPWLAQQTNGQWQLGLWGTLALASFGWVGVRGMTWFLFGRFGTPALLAILGRETVKHGRAATGEERVAAVRPDPLTGSIAALKKETEWFKREALYVFELVSLPVLQLFAAALNFVAVVITSRPMFNLPFASIDDVLAATPSFAASKSAGAPSAESVPQLRVEGLR